MAELTTMMQQYLQIKEQNQDAILFFRLGDFYEMFGADAKTASRELDLTLTTRDKSKDKPAEERMPMCGVPYHSADSYIARLIAKGYKVAICEQTEDPAQAKGLVKRDIIRVVTPGTVIDSACLEEGRSNFCAGIYLDEDYAALCACDITTGKAHATAFSGPERVKQLINELARFSPAEAVVNEAAFFDETLHTFLQDKLNCHLEKLPAGRFQMEAAEKLIRRQFGDDALHRLPRDNPAVFLALGALLSYLHETQKTDLSHVDDLEYYRRGQFMELDLTARRNLELTETLRSKEKKGSLLWVLDKTKTAMGGRLMRAWLERPLLSVTEIDRRSAAVAALVEHTVEREELILALQGISDMERLVGRIVYGTAGGRDLASLRAAMEKLPLVKAQLSCFEKGRLHQLNEALDDLNDLAALIGQTLVNGERYITQELKDLEHDILSAEDRVKALEYQLFTDLRLHVAEQAARVQRAAAIVAELDALCSLAAVAVKNNYCCPVVDESGVIEIHDGRHPVVEQMRRDSMFVPNDTYMGEKDDRVAIITGPNMAGKSTYMRQVALIVLMAQIGSFVPARAARIGVVDRIFTRIGASDDLSAGQSTFMVEMTEVSDILKAATADSLLILDEIGRGTSTFDGMSIARAVLEYCADPKKLGAKTLFATHYHELTALEGELPGVRNYNIAVRTRGEDIIFLRKIISGGADRSYGIEVAKLAGLPKQVLTRARHILQELEDEAGKPHAAPVETDQVSLEALSESAVIDQLRRAQVDTLSPLEALNLLYELKSKLS